MKEIPNIEGMHIPSVTIKTRVRDESVTPNPFKWVDVDSKDYFTGKRIVLFALPGAFTPTCSEFQLPGYEGLYQQFKDLGIDEVYCLSVNDAFVMFNWWKHQQIEHVKYIPDGSGEFTKAMGMLVEKDNLGFGARSWRYSMFVVDGVVQKAFIEPGFSDNCPDDPFTVSDAQTMIGYLSTLS